ncbi:MAG: chromosome segregation protein SMC [Gammaproteobacteria bacterium AqS3]|nr:chromosome segregation protein SMC [Gammaproteobacteria bacterium AqS3]
MNLREIKIAGFKSFMTPTSLQFTPQVSAVVGPNGCGKSNVVEAIRWVLGESSAKALRAARGPDVIFSGTDAHKPMGQCSVELVFDNSDGTIGGGYAAYSEISVRRQMTSDGASVYAINSRTARRRDVQKVFRGTGLGARSYSIIEQGLAAQLVTAGPESLLEQIEEAAGVSAYRENRRQTQQSIARTRSHLAEVSHLMDEVAARVRQLQYQTRAVERERRLRTEQSLLRTQLAALRWGELHRIVGDRQNAVRQASQSIEDARAEQLSLRAQHEQLERAFDAAQERFDAAQQDQVRLGAAREVAQERLDGAQNRCTQSGARVSELERALAEAAGERKVRETEQTECTAALETNRSALAEIEAELRRVQPQSEDAGVEALHAELSVRAQELATAAQLGQQNSRTLEAALSDLDARMQAVRADLPLAEDTAQLEHQLQAARDELRDLTAQLGELRQRSPALGAARDAASAAVDASVRALAECEAGIGVLSGQLEQLRRREGAADTPGSAARWSREHGLERIDLQVEEAWQSAVERVLGWLIDAYSVADESWLVRLAEIDSGALGMVSGNGPEPEIPAGSLAEVVRAPAPLLALLGQVGRAEDDAAVAELLGRFERVALPDGRLYGRGWASRGGEGEVIGVAERTQAIAELQSRRGQTERQLGEQRAQLDAARASLTEVSEAIQQGSLHQRELQSQVREAETALRARTEALEEGARTLQSLQVRRDETAGELSRTSEALAAVRAEQAEIQPQLERLGEILETERSARRELERRLHECYQRQRELSVEAEALSGRLAHAQDRIGAIDAAFETQNRALDEARIRAGEDEAALQQQRAQMQGLLDEAGKSETAFSHAQGALAAARDQRGESQRRIEAGGEAAQQFEGTLNEAKIRLATAERDLEHAAAALQDADPQAVLAELPEGAAAADWEEQLQQLATKIQRLGALNYAAAEELEVEKTRLAEFEQQRDEIEAAIAELERADAEIETEARRRFDVAFARIRQEFTAKFRLLFDGGEADLVHQENGVRIEAVPPGKNTRALSLLSGGEKSLVAIALVLAIFELNPAPLCVMDEVDAALDESNSLNFSRLIVEMSRQVQFVLVTHNKVVMEAAELLHGVTMREPGVSRVVGINLQQADELLQQQSG